MCRPSMRTDSKVTINNRDRFLRPKVRINNVFFFFFFFFFYFTFLDWGISANAGFHIPPVTYNSVRSITIIVGQVI